MARHGRAQPQGVLFVRDQGFRAPSQAVSLAAPALRIGLGAGFQANRTAIVTAPALRFNQAAGQQVNRTVPAVASALRFTVQPASVSGAQTANLTASALRITVLAATVTGGAQPTVTAPAGIPEKYKLMSTVHIPNAEWGAPLFTGRGIGPKKADPQYVTARSRVVLRLPTLVARAWGLAEPEVVTAAARPVVLPKRLVATASGAVQIRPIAARSRILLQPTLIAKAAGTVQSGEDELLVLAGLLDEEHWL